MTVARRGVNPQAARYLLLGCACFLSVGSHFGSYLLGPIKSDLGAGESGFASLLSAFEVVNTITPLLSGFLVPKFGAARCGLFATGFVLFGQVLVVWFQRHALKGQEQSVGGMALGLLIFGLGISPLAVVQESIIIGFSASSGSGGALGRSLAIGLLLGKTSSWVASVVAVPLESLSPRAPFLVATALSLLSFTGCVIYWAVERWGLAPHVQLTSADSDHEGGGGGGGLMRGGHSKHAVKRIPSAHEVENYSDAFWLYIPICALAGTWYSTIHLSSSLLQSLYAVDKSKAASAASVILLSSTFIYPVLGTVFDKRPRALPAMYLALPSAIALSFVILLAFKWLVPWFLAWIPCALGIGSGPLLLVLVVPKLVEPEQAPTALGLHKAVEMGAAVYVQSISSWILESALDDPATGAARVVGFLLLLVLAQLGAIVVFLRALKERQAQQARKGNEIPLDDGGEYDVLGPIETEDDDAHELGQEAESLKKTGARKVSHEEDEDEGEHTDDAPELLATRGVEDEPPVRKRVGLRRVWATGSFLVLSWVMFAVNLVLAEKEGKS